MAEEELNVNEILRDQEEKVKRTLSEIDYVHGRYWSQRNEFVKALVPIISAVFVATVAFSDSILGDSGTKAAVWLLMLSWAGLVVALLAALFSMWFSLTLSTFGARFFNTRPQREKSINELQPNDPENFNKLVAIFKSSFDAAFNPVGSADIRADRSLKTSIVVFAIALVLLFASGSVNLLCTSNKSSQPTANVAAELSR